MWGTAGQWRNFLESTFYFWIKAQELGRVVRANTFEVIFGWDIMFLICHVRSSGTDDCNPTAGWLVNGFIISCLSWVVKETCFICRALFGPRHGYCLVPFWFEFCFCHRVQGWKHLLHLFRWKSLLERQVFVRQFSAGLPVMIRCVQWWTDLNRTSANQWRELRPAIIVHINLTHFNLHRSSFYQCSISPGVTGHFTGLG